MTNKIRAMVMPAPNAPLELREYDEPRLDPGAVLLETMISEVCGTDVHLHHGRLSGVPYPIIPGHVSVGRIRAMAGPLSDVDGNPFHEGDVVAFLDVHETCGACHACLVTRESTRCPHRKVYGITYSAADGLLGGWSEAIWLKPGVKLLRLPAGLDPEVYCAGGCGLVTALHAVDRAGLRLGESVVVLGAGPVGLCTAALARLSGAGEVVVVGAPEARLAFARRMGASLTLALEVPATARRQQILGLTGGHGADAVIEVSGAPEAVVQGLEMVRDGGRLVVAGHYTDTGPVALNPHLHVNRKHVEIRGCWGSNFSHFHRALALLARHQTTFPWREMVTNRYALDRLPDALRAVTEHREIKALVLPGGVS